LSPKSQTGSFNKFFWPRNPSAAFLHIEDNRHGLRRGAPIRRQFPRTPNLIQLAKAKQDVRWLVQFGVHIDAAYRIAEYGTIMGMMVRSNRLRRPTRFPAVPGTELGA